MMCSERSSGASTAITDRPSPFAFTDDRRSHGQHRLLAGPDRRGLSSIERYCADTAPFFPRWLGPRRIAGAVFRRRNAMKARTSVRRALLFGGSADRSSPAVLLARGRAGFDPIQIALIDGVSRGRVQVEGAGDLRSEHAR